MFMRHRYNNCVETLLEHLSYEVHAAQVSLVGVSMLTGLLPQIIKMCLNGYCSVEVIYSGKQPCCGICTFFINNILV